MSNKIKDIDIKNHTYYFFDDIIINIKHFDLNDIKNRLKFIQKYSYFLYWICDDQRFKLHQK